MNKRIDLIFDLAREATENEEVSATTGISTNLLIQAINDAQLRLLSKITLTHPNVFVVESPLIDVNVDQESYPLPDDIFLENRITLVEFSDTGLREDLHKLTKTTLYSRENKSTGFPARYVRRSGDILLQPIPSSTGVIRINYQRRVPQLDIRRGQISAVTLNTTTRKITSLTIDPAQDDFDPTTINKNDFISFVSVLGEQQMTRIQVDSVDTTTGVITVNSNFTYEVGETLAIGDYCAIGFSASTHSELPLVCERYLLSYVKWILLKLDSSEDGIEARNELTGIERDIVESFSEIDDDIIYIPMID